MVEERLRSNSNARPKCVRNKTSVVSEERRILLVRFADETARPVQFVSGAAPRAPPARRAEGAMADRRPVGLVWHIV